MGIFPAAPLQVISKTEIHSTIVCHLVSHTVNPFVVQSAGFSKVHKKKPMKSPEAPGRNIHTKFCSCITF